MTGSLCVNQNQWDSGRSLRDLHTRRLFETETYPEACYRVRSKSDLPDSSNNGNRVRLHGTMQIHGVERNLTIRGVIHRTTTGRRFRGSFQTRITDWDMSPPQIVLMEVRDRVEVEVFLTLVPVQKIEDLQSGKSHPPTTARETQAPLYRAYCASCHHPSGRGIPGMAPPLRNRLGTILRHPNGRTYLARVVLFGLVGPITIQGTTHNGHMPAFTNMGTFDNKTAADLLNELVFQLNPRSHPTPFKPYTAEEIKKLRANPISPNRLHAIRKNILRGKSPDESIDDPNESER